MSAALYECARRDIRQLEQMVERLAPLARMGAANEPVPPHILGVSLASEGPGSRASPPSHSQANVSALRVTIPHAAPGRMPG